MWDKTIYFTTMTLPSTRYVLIAGFLLWISYIAFAQQMM